MGRAACLSGARRRPPHRQPDRAEPGIVHVIEVTLPQPELRAAPGGIQGIAEADPPPETAVHAIRRHAVITAQPAGARYALTSIMRAILVKPSMMLG